MTSTVINEINGVILTAEAQEQLKALQESGNEQLNYHIEDLADLVCLGHIVQDEIDDDTRRKQFEKVLTNLSYLREKLQVLRKP